MYLQIFSCGKYNFMEMSFHKKLKEYFYRCLETISFLLVYGLFTAFYIACWPAHGSKKSWVTGWVNKSNITGWSILFLLFCSWCLFYITSLLLKQALFL